MIVDRPVILDELFKICRRCDEGPAGREADSLRRRLILSQQLNRVRQVCPAIRPMRDVRANFYFVAAEPLHRRELIQRRPFELVGLSVPGIKKVACPTVRSKQHVCESLAVCIAVKSRVAKPYPQKLVGSEVMKVRNTYRNPF